MKVDVKYRYLGEPGSRDRRFWYFCVETCLVCRVPRKINFLIQTYVFVYVALEDTIWENCGCKWFITIVLSIFYLTVLKKGIKISMPRVFRTICTFFLPKSAFYQKIRTFAFSKNRTFPKNEDFCIFAKKYLSKKSGLSPKIATHASPDFKQSGV